MSASHPGRETWQLPDGRTGVECAAQLERGDGAPNEFKALVVFLKEVFLLTADFAVVTFQQQFNGVSNNDDNASTG